MTKIKYYNNTLIKRKNLLILIKKAGIKRISKDALDLMEQYFKDELNILSKLLREEIAVNGRKTLKKEDIHQVISMLNKKDISWEV